MARISNTYFTKKDNDRVEQATSPSNSMVAALSCFVWLFECLRSQKKGIGEPKEIKTRWLYFMPIFMRGMIDDHNAAFKHQLYGIVQSIHECHDYTINSNATPKVRRRWIETTFYKRCLSCGPIPPPRCTDVFFFRRSTAEWTLKPKELAAIVKELSELELVQLASIVWHQNDGLGLLLGDGRMPESFLDHPEFLKGLKNCMFAKTDFYFLNRRDPENMIEHLKGMVHIQNPEAVKKLLYSE